MEVKRRKKVYYNNTLSKELVLLALVFLFEKKIFHTLTAS